MIQLHVSIIQLLVRFIRLLMRFIHLLIRLIHLLMRFIPLLLRVNLLSYQRSLIICVNKMGVSVIALHLFMLHYGQFI